MSRVWGITRADFLERARRFSFIAMLALALFGAFWFVPRDDGTMQVMLIQPDRFIQADNPSWIPIASAWGLGFFLPLFGFFYLRNAVQFDESAGLSQWVFTTTIGKVRYLMGKWLSHIVLLLPAMAVVIAGSFFMMLWHFPGQALSVHDFLSPFLYLFAVIPLIASLAILFESVRFLRGAIGAFLYVVAFVAAYAYFAMSDANPPMWFRIFDFTGTTFIVRAIHQAVLEQSGKPLDALMFLGGGFEYTSSATRSLIFHGVTLTAQEGLALLGMLGVSLGATLFSAPLYALSQKTASLGLPKAGRKKTKAEASPLDAPVSYVPVLQSARGDLVHVIAAETRLMLTGRTVPWRLVCLGFWVACIFAELRTVQNMLLPLLLLWSVNMYSAMGSREHQSGMMQLITGTPRGRTRQVLGSWFAGFFIATVLGLPCLIRLALAGQGELAFACATGILFLPSLALFCGEWTKTPRCFEVILVVMTYLILNGVAGAMYTGANGHGSMIFQGVIYGVVGLALAGAGMGKRVLMLHD